jgi:hypothetical protein
VLELRKQCERTVSLLDDAFAESQVAVPAGRDHKGEHEKATTQLHLAFDMALDACRTMTQRFEEVELLLSQSSALMGYFSPTTTAPNTNDRETTHDRRELVDLLLGLAHSRVPTEHIRTSQQRISVLLRNPTLRHHVASLVFHNPASREPVQREYVIRCLCPRPYLDAVPLYDPIREGEGEDPELESRIAFDRNDDRAVLDLLDESPVVVNRMFASFTKHTVRFALTLAESEF